MQCSDFAGMLGGLFNVCAKYVNVSYKISRKTAYDAVGRDNKDRDNYVQHIDEKVACVCRDLPNGEHCLYSDDRITVTVTVHKSTLQPVETHRERRLRVLEEQRKKNDSNIDKQ